MTSGRVDELTQQIEDMPTVDLVAALKRVLALADTWEALGITSVYESSLELADMIRGAVSGDQS